MALPAPARACVQSVLSHPCWHRPDASSSSSLFRSHQHAATAWQRPAVGACHAPARPAQAGGAGRLQDLAQGRTDDLQHGVGSGRAALDLRGGPPQPMPAQRDHSGAGTGPGRHLDGQDAKQEDLQRGARRVPATSGALAAPPSLAEHRKQRRPDPRMQQLQGAARAPAAAATQRRRPPEGAGDAVDVGLVGALQQRGRPGPAEQAASAASPAWPPSHTAWSPAPASTGACGSGAPLADDVLSQHSAAGQPWAPRSAHRAASAARMRTTAIRPVLMDRPQVLYCSLVCLVPPHLGGQWVSARPAPAAATRAGSLPVVHPDHADGDEGEDRPARARTVSPPPGARPQRNMSREPTQSLRTGAGVKGAGCWPGTR